MGEAESLFQNEPQVPLVQYICLKLCINCCNQFFRLLVKKKKNPMERRMDFQLNFQKLLYSLEASTNNLLWKVLWYLQHFDLLWCVKCFTDKVGLVIQFKMANSLTNLSQHKNGLTVQLTYVELRFDVIVTESH